MRFLLYNISYGAGVGYRLHFPFPYAGHVKKTRKNLNRIAEFIKSTTPDIVGLVEVDSGSFRTRKKNQAQLIAEELNHFHVFKSKYGSGSFARRVPVMNKQGNAVLVNRKIASRRFHYFTNGIKKLVIEVGLDNVIIFLVHLSLKYRHRQYQLHELYQIVRSADRPVIVAGDFNAFSGGQELGLFLAASGLKSANGFGNPSYPSRMPKKELDFIFHSPEIRTDHFEIPRVRLSDHAPLIWDFRISGRRRATA